MPVEILLAGIENFQLIREIIEVNPASNTLAVLREDHGHGPELVPESAGDILWIIYPIALDDLFWMWEPVWRQMAPSFRINECGWCRLVPWEWENQEREE